MLPNFSLILFHLRHCIFIRDINFTFRYLPKLEASAPPAVRHRKRLPSRSIQKTPHILKEASIQLEDFHSLLSLKGQ